MSNAAVLISDPTADVSNAAVLISDPTADVSNAAVLISDPTPAPPLQGRGAATALFAKWTP